MDLNSIYDMIAPVWIELTCVLVMSVFFALSRKRNEKVYKSKALEHKEPSRTRAFDVELVKTIEAESTTGHQAAVLAAWRKGAASAPSTPELLRAAVQAFLETEREALVSEIIRHIRQHSSELCNPRAATVALDVLARAGAIGLMEELWLTLWGSLGVAPTALIYETLLGGFALAGDGAKVSKALDQLQGERIRPTVRSYMLVLKGYLKNGMPDAVLQWALDMNGLGIQVPPFAITQFVRIAVEAGRLDEFSHTVWSNFPVSEEAFALCAANLCRRGDAAQMAELEQRGREASMPFNATIYEMFLKLYAAAGDAHSLEVWDEMLAKGITPSESLLSTILMRCATSKFMRLAEQVFKYVRASGISTIALYSSIMKVYAYCGLYGRACDLYDDIIEDGLEPDAIMYGCLMRFAVECGRTELSRKLSERAPSLDIQNYMSLIRAAGRDKDVNRAFAVLAELKKSGVPTDVAAHNCVLDACVSAGNMERALFLVEELKKIGEPDIITYNTLLKGFCNTRDLEGAKALLRDMERRGLQPNDVSYNCLINAAVSVGRLRDAWDTIDWMERKGVPVDYYTVSIMMKALKNSSNQTDVKQALALLDRTKLDVCSDDILLNTVLETCLRHRKYDRIEVILRNFGKSGFQPSVPTYGSLIKASSTMRNVAQCWDFWNDMVQTKGMEPNDIVLGCMLDALVSNEQIEEAVTLLNQWKERLPPNAITYSTIIKGFAVSNQSKRALHLWQDMRKDGVQCNTVLYNAVIDAQARVGAMDDIFLIMESMAEDGRKPDAITYSTIVKGYCVTGDLKKAFEIFRNMQQTDMAVDSIVYNTMLDGCTRHNQPELAQTILDDMEKYNIRPSNFTLGILVKMYGRRKQLDKAFEALAVLPVKHGFTPNAQVYTCLMRTCLNNGCLDRALQVFQELKRSGSGADAKAYSAIIGGCVRQCQFEQAVELVEEAKRGTSALESEAVEQLSRRLARDGRDDLLERLRRCGAQKSSYGNNQRQQPLQQRPSHLHQQRSQW